MDPVALQNLLNDSFANGAISGMALLIVLKWAWNWITKFTVAECVEEEGVQVQRVMNRLNHKAFDWQKFGEAPGIAPQKRGRANG